MALRHTSDNLVHCSDTIHIWHWYLDFGDGANYSYTSKIIIGDIPSFYWQSPLIYKAPFSIIWHNSGINYWPNTSLIWHCPSCVWHLSFWIWLLTSYPGTQFIFCADFTPYLSTHCVLGFVGNTQIIAFSTMSDHVSAFSICSASQVRVFDQWCQIGCRTNHFVYLPILIHSLCSWARLKATDYSF